MPLQQHGWTQSIILSKVSQAEEQKYCVTSLMHGIEKQEIQMKIFTKQEQTHRHRKQPYSYQREQWGGKRGKINQEFEIQRYKTTRTYYRAQGTVFGILYKSIMEKNLEKSLSHMHIYTHILLQSYSYRSQEPGLILREPIYLWPAVCLFRTAMAEERWAVTDGYFRVIGRVGQVFMME